MSITRCATCSCERENPTNKIEEAIRKEVVKAGKKLKWNRTKMAWELGISRPTVLKYIEKFKLNPEK